MVFVFDLFLNYDSVGSPCVFHFLSSFGHILIAISVGADGKTVEASGTTTLDHRDANKA